MKGATTKVFSVGQNQLKSNLNEDIYQGQFIKSKMSRWIYTKLTQFSGNVFSFILIYLASTRQLEQLDPINYYQQTKKRTLLYIVLGLTIFCYFSDRIFHEWDEKKQQVSEDEKVQSDGPSLPQKKMILQCFSDILRVIDYYLVFYILNEDIFSTTTNSHLIVTKYSLVVLWFLFVARKVIFWYHILFVQHFDQQPWDQREEINDKLKEIYSVVDSKFGQINAILNALEGMKEDKQGQKKKKTK